MTTIREYIRPKSLEEAYELNQKKQNRIAGGMLWLRLGNGSIGTLIDLCDLGLSDLTEDENTIRIGAMATLRQMELHEGLNRYTCGAAAEAVKNIVGVQFRNSATAGGSIWGRFGFSDVLTMLLSTDCSVELYKGGTVSLEEFVSMKRDSDLLLSLTIRKRPGKFAYRSMRIQRTDFPVLTAAASCVDGEYRAVIGARPARAMVVRDTQNILAHGITEESAGQFAEYAAESVPVSGNMRGSAGYRKQLVRVLTKRNMLELGGLLK